MDQAFLAKQKELLLQRKAELERELSAFAKRSAKEPGGFQTRFPEYGRSSEDNAAEVADYSALRSMEQNLEEHLEKVKRALQRIAEGTYGKCEQCGKEIERARLEAEPVAAACLACAK
jgi:RNA polymerase-binding transcription factor DksA